MPLSRSLSWRRRKQDATGTSLVSCAVEPSLCPSNDAGGRESALLTSLHSRQTLPQSLQSPSCLPRTTTISPRPRRTNNPLPALPSRPRAAVTAREDTEGPSPPSSLAPSSGRTRRRRIRRPRQLHRRSFTCGRLRCPQRAPVLPDTPLPSASTTSLLPPCPQRRLPPRLFSLVIRDRAVASRTRRFSRPSFNRCAPTSTTVLPPNPPLVPPRNPCLPPSLLPFPYRLRRKTLLHPLTPSPGWTATLSLRPCRRRKSNGPSSSRRLRLARRSRESEEGTPTSRERRRAAGRRRVKRTVRTIATQA
jgi:hypothetical protein